MLERKQRQYEVNGNSSSGYPTKTGISCWTRAKRLGRGPRSGTVHCRAGRKSLRWPPQPWIEFFLQHHNFHYKSDGMYQARRSVHGRRLAASANRGGRGRDPHGPIGNRPIHWVELVDFDRHKHRIAPIIQVSQSPNTKIACHNVEKGDYPFQLYS